MPGAMMPAIRAETVPQTVPIKSISAFRRTKWDEFARDFSVQVYNNKADYKRNSLILSALLALLGGVATYFISGHALRPIREFSKKIEEVQAQNLADSRIEENKSKRAEPASYFV